jgi:hypothetical protein
VLLAESRDRHIDKEGPISCLSHTLKRKVFLRYILQLFTLLVSQFMFLIENNHKVYIKIKTCFVSNGIYKPFNVIETFHGIL